MDEVDGLPEDVYLEIFSRDLPKKSRLWCGAVSKRWQNMIGKSTSDSSPRACRLIDSGFVHVNHWNKDWTTQIYYRWDDKGSVHLQDSLVFPKSNPLWLTGSSNGFLYMSKKDAASFRSHILYNPVTRKLTTLPPFPPLIKMYVGEDNPSAIGFALDLDTHHYKYLVVSFNFLGIAKVAIFNSETGEWKSDLGKKFKTVTYFNGAATLYCKGSLYWLDAFYMSVFCMKSESFRCICLPEPGQRYRGVVWESDGRIHYCQFCNIQGLRIWVLMEDNRPQAGSDPNNIISTGGDPINWMKIYSNIYNMITTRGPIWRKIYSNIYNMMISIRGNSIWRKIYSLDKNTLNSILAEAIRPVPHCNNIEGPIRIIRVYAFNEHLQIIYLHTSHGPFSYDILAKTAFPLSPSYSVPPLDDMRSFQLPFTYNKMELITRNQ